MSLYDIINEITEKQVTKTATGDTRVNGIMIGIVAKNYDNDMPGRVCVSIPTRDEDANELKWMRMISQSSGKSWGHYFLPEVGDQVAIAFDGGNIEKPYIIGCIPKDNNKFLTGSVTEKNEIKRIVTKHGNTIVFEDNQGNDDGKNDKITISTAQNSHTVLLDNENSLIRITDKKKENYIEMKTEDGMMTVKVKSKITIMVGDTIKVILNGETGSVSVSASEIKMEASKQLKATTDGMMSLEASQITEKASSLFKVESSGMVNISGAPIKIG